MGNESKEYIDFNVWLRDDLYERAGGRYRHRRMDEVEDLREKVLPQLGQVVFDAHEDMRRHLRDLEGVPLDPLEIPPGQDPAEGYPGQKLHLTTLMGYFGEIFSGILCEKFAPLGDTRWKVPAYLFRFHLEEDRHLDQIEQMGKAENPEKEKRFGRKGNDCLAFIMNESGDITHSLFCEAKCVSRHRTRSVKQNDQVIGHTDEVSDAHEKLSGKELRPVDRRRLIEILKDYPEDAEAMKWVEALRRMRLHQLPEYERCDLVCCIYGQKREVGETWIPKDAPHPKYQADRRLEAVEIYIHNVQQIVCEVYGVEK